MEKLNIEKIRVESEMEQKTMDMEKDVKLGENLDEEGYKQSRKYKTSQTLVGEI